MLKNFFKKKSSSEFPIYKSALSGIEIRDPEAAIRAITTIEGIKSERRAFNQKQIERFKAHSESYTGYAKRHAVQLFQDFLSHAKTAKAEAFNEKNVTDAVESCRKSIGEGSLEILDHVARTTDAMESRLDQAAEEDIARLSKEQDKIADHFGLEIIRPKSGSSQRIQVNHPRSLTSPR